jgi:hypothetical protein
MAQALTAFAVFPTVRLQLDNPALPITPFGWLWMQACALPIMAGSTSRRMRISQTRVDLGQVPGSLTAADAARVV